MPNSARKLAPWCLLLAAATGRIDSFAADRTADPAALRRAIDTIRAVGPEGQGHTAATGAWRELAAGDAQQMIAILEGMKGANPLARNWLRAAVDTIGERTLGRSAALPKEQLERFVLNHDQAPRARQLAFSWLVEVDRSGADRLLPRMLDDPSLELRRRAVQQVLDAARQAPADDARRLYQKAFAAARDHDQIQDCYEALERLGVATDLARHFGYLVDWHVIGPFDNTGQKGFATAYPPEGKVDLADTLAGKTDQVSWRAVHTDDKEGRVDLNDLVGKLKGVVAYAAASFVSDKERTVELRWGSQNATKVWVNGRLVAQHEIYHTGTTPDQYRCEAPFHRGDNLILVKVCQDEQTEAWTENWAFKLRVTDSLGGAIRAQ
ncbi:MAG: hypothetical protein BMS9Abin04_404 [Planctomycetia bacterium]|nr:MAG: hypothetical protein BMS9Abin04_404 [Planctomycetia bacterium]